MHFYHLDETYAMMKSNLHLDSLCIPVYTAVPILVVNNVNELDWMLICSIF